MAILIILIIVIIFAFQNIVSKGAAALSTGYSAAFDSEKESAYQMLYQKYYQEAESKYHVANRTSIHIENIKETNKLEVLRVSDVEFIIEDSGANKDKITSWLEVPGEGTYVVDLSLAEFIIDNERSYVLVRLPYPELTNITIDYSNVKPLLFEKQGISNGDFKAGEALADKQLREADVMIKKEFASNERFYLNAQDAARSSIQFLIHQMNPDIDGLTIEVKFY